MATILVSSVEELYSALSTAQGGEIIELASGTYERIGIWKGLDFEVNFEPSVTIRSADPSNPAVVENMAIRNASGLTFDGIYFDYDAPIGKTYKDRPFEIEDSSNIKIINSIFDGDLAEGVSARADGFGTGMGLVIKGSENVVVENNEFFDWYKALSFGGGTYYTARGNDIHSIRNDGMSVTKSQYVLIEDNYIHDFKRNLEAGDHSDMIQFWTVNNKEPITDVVIRNNRLDIGDGDHTQSIFMRNEAVDVQGAGEEMFYQRITIEDNLIINGHSNGIVLGGADDVVISNNILLHSDGGSPRDAGHLELPTIRVAGYSTDVVITENVAFRTPSADGKTNWLVTENTLVQDLKVDGAGYYVDASDLLVGTVWEDGALSAQDASFLGDAAMATFIEVEEPAEVNKLDLHYDANEGYVADFADLSDDGAKVIRDGVRYEETTGGFEFNGQKGSVVLGKLHEYRDTDQLTMSMRYTVDNVSEMGQLFNNHMRLAMAIEDGTLILRTATENEGFKRYNIDVQDMAIGEEHRLTVALDRVDDHLQVLLDGEVILDDTTTDFANREGMHNWGWTLGNVWHKSFDGTIEDFSLTDQAHFQPNADLDALVA